MVGGGCIVIPVAKPSRAEYQPVTIVEWPRNKREVIRVRLDRYNGRDTVDLRTWYRDQNGDLRPTPKGLTLAVDHLPALAAAVNQALHAACERGLIVEDVANQTGTPSIAAAGK
jgi:hypothetical protein